MRILRAKIGFLPKKYIKKTCENSDCEKEFIVVDGKIGRKYCSSRCFGKHRGFQKGHTSPFKGKHLQHLPENIKKTLSKFKFPKGHIPWNMGLKGYKPPNPKRFKKGHVPWNKGKHVNQTYWIGRHHVEATCEKISKSLKGIRNSVKTEFKKGHVPWWSQRGLKNPTQVPNIKRKLSEKVKASYRANPESHPNRIMAKNGFISKPQRRLFEFLKDFYPDAELECPIVTAQGIRFADVGVPSLKIDFEYDSEYWHRGMEKRDLERDGEIKSAGWNVIRIKQILDRL